MGDSRHFSSNGEIWDALLYYSQVEKDFKESIGHEQNLEKLKYIIIKEI